MGVHTETVEARVPRIDEPGSRTYKIRPLRGQVLVRLLPPEYNLAGGLVLPDYLPLFEERGDKKLPRKAIVIAVGQWRKTKQGFHILPDFHPGQRVLVSEYFGTKLTRNIGEEYRLCRIDDVLAIVETELTSPEPKT